MNHYGEPGSRDSRLDFSWSVVTHTCMHRRCLASISSQPIQPHPSCTYVCAASASASSPSHLTPPLSSYTCLHVNRYEYPFERFAEVITDFNKVLLPSPPSRKKAPLLPCPTRREQERLIPFPPRPYHTDTLSLIQKNSLPPNHNTTPHTVHSRLRPAPQGLPPGRLRDLLHAAHARQAPRLVLPPRQGVRLHACVCIVCVCVHAQGTVRWCFF